MKKSIITLSAVISLTYAIDTVPYNFTSGDLIKASEINANFDYLSNLITTLRSQIETLESKNISSLRKFVGISDVSLSGSSGILSMNKTCNDKFVGSSMCTTEEAFYSSTIEGVSGKAWINPVATSTSGTPVDKITLLTARSCGGWTISTTTGYALNTANGEIIINEICTHSIPVSCCK